MSCLDGFYNFGLCDGVTLHDDFQSTSDHEKSLSIVIALRVTNVLNSDEILNHSCQLLA